MRSIEGMDNSGRQMMKAVTIPEFGDAEVLRVATIPVPEPGPGQVAIDVAYAGANFAEVLYRRGVVDVPLSPSACMQTKPTTGLTCADGFDGSASDYASPAKASSPAND
ncbi:hypothetical protein [Streptomyces sp. MK37H]|uniref:hypothetical protein n=1 Tax=Streptomyces sp. MK37H TaxID=2699117 RepID=UPI0035A89B01